MDKSTQTKTGEGNAPRQARAERRAECKARRNGQSVKEAGKAVTKDSRRIPNPTLVGNAPRCKNGHILKPATQCIDGERLAAERAILAAIAKAEGRAQ